MKKLVLRYQYQWCNLRDQANESLEALSFKFAASQQELYIHPFRQHLTETVQNPPQVAAWPDHDPDEIFKDKEIKSCAQLPSFTSRHISFVKLVVSSHSSCPVAVRSRSDQC